MIWFKYGTHDYMDMHPEYGYRLFDSAEQAQAWQEHMRKNYASGTTWIVGPAKKQEMLQYIEDNHLSLDDKTMENINNNNYYQTI